MTKQILAFLFCFTRELNLCSPLVTIFHIQICYQLLQTRPTGEKRYQLLQTHPPTHSSATNPQPFCLPGDDCRTYGRLTDPKKNPPSKSLRQKHGAACTARMQPARLHSALHRNQFAAHRPAHLPCITAHRANATSPRAAHRKQSAHRAGRRLHR